MKLKDRRIIFGFVMFACIVSSIFFFFVYKKRTPISMERIEELADEKNYKYYDLNEMIDSDIGKLCAIGFDDVGNIQFTVVNSETDAVGIYNVSCSKFGLNKTVGDAEHKMDSKHYSKYELTTKDQYMVCIRVYNTLLYSSVPRKYEKKVKEVIEEVKY